MVVIDDEGRLFGVVNVVDALVVLVVLAVVVAGVGLVWGGSPADAGTSDTEATRYATLEFSAPVESPIASLAEGDALTPVRGGDTFNVTDVVRSVDPNGSTHFVVRAAYDDPPTESGRRLYGGDTTSLTTGSYRIDATVLAVNQSDGTLVTETVPVVLAVNASTPVRRGLEEGQRIQAGADTVATIRTLARGGETGTRWLVGADLAAWNRSGTPFFGGRALRIGNRVTLVTDEIVVRGRIYARGTSDAEEVASSE